MTETQNSCVAPEELSAHIDGDLTEPRKSAVEKHLKTCVTCYGMVREFEELKTDLKDLAHVRPGLNLWRKIDDALDDEPERIETKPSILGWLLPIPVAAAAVLTIVLIRQFVDVETPEEEIASTQDIAHAMETVDRAESAYREAILSLEKVYKTEKNSFSPETLAVVEKSLEEIDAAIERCREAIAKDPSNMEANRAMLAAYRQKMDFLFELVGPKLRPEGA